MNSKLAMLFATLLLSALVFQASEGILFTVGGLWLDKNIAFTLFGKFLHIFHSLGRREAPEPINWARATPEQYLSVATSIDTDRCLPLAVCVAMAKTRDETSQRSKFDDLVIDTFESKIKEASSVATADRVSPLSYYVQAAKFGQTVGVADGCRVLSPTCNYTLAELGQLTTAASQ